MDPETNYLHPEECSGWLEIALDIFVVTKAVALIYFSVQGMIWFWKSSFTAISVLGTLLISMGLVSTLSSYSFYPNLNYFSDIGPSRGSIQIHTP